MSRKAKTFEESMQRLEEIVRLLEENKLPLDESIALFEEGLQLSKDCDTKLKDFYKKKGVLRIVIGSGSVEETSKRTLEAIGE